MQISRRLINVVANVCLLVSAGALGTAVWQKYSQAHRLARSQTRLPFQPGDRAPVISGISYREQSSSLVIFLSTMCHYCESSVPFYNRLTGLSSHRGLRLFAVFAQPEDQVQSFRGRLGLLVDSVPGVNFSRIRVGSTPTVLLIDRIGVIKRTWVGVSTQNEAEIIRALAE